MAYKMYDELDIKAIADAIRYKNKTSNKYLVSEMSDAIMAIEGNFSDGSSSDSSVIGSGSYGTNITWRLLSNGEFIIDGQGDVDFGYIADANSTINFDDKITKIIINEGIDEISNAILSLENLRSIVIPSTLKKILNYTFFDAELLSDVYYAGSSSEWESIDIGGSNDNLVNATLHFNYNYNNNSGNIDTINGWHINVITDGTEPPDNIDANTISFICTEV